MKKLKKTAFLVLLTCTLTKLTANDDASDLSQWTGLKNCFAEFLKQESYYTDTKKSFSQKTYEDLLSILNNRTKFVKKLVEDPTTFQRSSYILLMEWLTAFDYLNNTQFKDFFEDLADIFSSLILEILYLITFT